VADGWNKVYADHVAQFTSLMGRVTLQLGDAASTMTTNQLIDNYAKAANRPKADGLFLEQLYFQYGRYLEISCNNILINAPSNLQGLWNDNSNTSFWHCDIHADVNVQMNYWPAEATNLSTMHLPFLNNIITLSQDKYNYHRLAQRYKSGVRGWMLPTENNIFGGTSSWMAFQIKTMSAWNCSHLWQHYRYTLDRDFLCRALPAMLRAAQFLKDISTKAANGTYYVADEYSPEHGPSGHSTAFAQQNTAELVRSILEGVEVLGEESPIAQQDYQEMKDFYEVLDKGLHTETYNGNTCLREWADLTLNSQGDAASHRHLSHLMALFPYGQVSAYATDEEDKKMFKAAVNSLHVRNSTDVTGWSAGWKVNLHARALEGNRAHNIFPQMLRHSTSYVIQMSGQGGCYYNLWDSHSPFQIDGNFGYTSGVAEMLLQSYDGNLHLLPALPTVWKNGRVSGLKAVGDFTVDQEWADGVLTAATIVNNQGQPLTLTLGKLPVGKTVQATVNEVQVKVTENASGSFTIPTAAAGDVVRLTLVDREESGISPVSADDLQNERAYSLSGLPVNSSYHGLVVQKKKVMLKH
jgi:alpha-L-fucosidase 2